MEVGAGGEAGVPLVAKGFVEAALQSTFGLGSTVSHTVSLSHAVHVHSCWKASATMYVIVFKGREQVIRHDYLYFVTVPPGTDCPEAGAEVLFFVCPEARRSSLRSDDWSDLGAAARTFDRAHCCD